MTDGLLSLSWNNHKATFCHILSTLREKERYTDVTLACEGKFYPTHKFVLSTCSEYFEKMFENTSCKHPVILLGKDVKCDELEALLSYMYDGVVSVAQNDLARLIKVAELLQIKGLAVPDEPPQPKKNYAWSSRDDRTSPHPKRRRREENSMVGPSDRAGSPSASPRTEADQSWDQSSTREGNATDGDVNQRLEYTPKQETDTVQNEGNSEETLVKEEIVETVDDSQNEDPGVDYSSHTGSDSATGGDDQTNKFVQNLDPMKSQPLHEAVVEALAGPSGMQGWLGTGDMGPGFPMLETYSEDGNQDTHPVPVTGTQQAHQMVWLDNDNQMAEKIGSHSARFFSNNRKPRETYRCPQCYYSCTKRYNFVRHCRTHTGERPFSCPHCPYQARDNSILSQHLHTHTRNKLYPCPQCPYQGKNRSSLTSHMLFHSHEPDNLYTCPHCPFQSRKNSELRYHLRTHQ